MSLKQRKINVKPKIKSKQNIHAHCIYKLSLTCQQYVHMSPTYCCASCLLFFTGIVILMLRIGFCARYFIQPWLQIIT